MEMTIRMEQQEVMTEPTLLSNCTNPIILDNNEKEPYRISYQEGTNLLLVMGFHSNKPAAKFSHPNIMATEKRIHEFKHYRKGGSKFWTAKSGVDHYLIIPRNKIIMLPEKGYSYVKTEINGVKISLNVSGGTCGKGWGDFFSSIVHTSVNHKLSDLKKVAEVAIRDSQIENGVEIKTLDEAELKRWDMLHAKSCPDIKNAIAKLAEDGKAPVIKLVGGFNEHTGIAIETCRRRIKKVEGNVWSWDYTGALKSLIVSFSSCRYRVKLNQIDWDGTAKLNGITA